MKKKENIILEVDPHDPTILIINGKKFCSKKVKLKRLDGIPHVDRILFGELDEEEYKKDLGLVVNTLKNHTTSEELITELMKEESPRVIKRLAKRIRAKKPVKKHKGCLGFKIGDAYIQMIGGVDY